MRSKRRLGSEEASVPVINPVPNPEVGQVGTGICYPSGMEGGFPVEVVETLPYEMWSRAVDQFGEGITVLVLRGMLLIRGYWSLALGSNDDDHWVLLSRLLATAEGRGDFLRIHRETSPRPSLLLSHPDGLFCLHLLCTPERRVDGIIDHVRSRAVSERDRA